MTASEATRARVCGHIVPAHQGAGRPREYCQKCYEELRRLQNQKSQEKYWLRLDEQPRKRVRASDQRWFRIRRTRRDFLAGVRNTAITAGMSRLSIPDIPPISLGEALAEVQALQALFARGSSHAPKIQRRTQTLLSQLDRSRLTGLGSERLIIWCEELLCDVGVPGESIDALLVRNQRAVDFWQGYDRLNCAKALIVRGNIYANRCWPIFCRAEDMDSDLKKAVRAEQEAFRILEGIYYRPRRHPAVVPLLASSLIQQVRLIAHYDNDPAAVKEQIELLEELLKETDATSLQLQIHRELAGYFRLAEVQNFDKAYEHLHITIDHAKRQPTPPLTILRPQINLLIEADKQTDAKKLVDEYATIWLDENRSIHHRYQLQLWDEKYKLPSPWRDTNVSNIVTTPYLNELYIPELFATL